MTWTAEVLVVCLAALGKATFNTVCFIAQGSLSPAFVLFSDFLQPSPAPASPSPVPSQPLSPPQPPPHTGILFNTTQGPAPTKSLRNMNQHPPTFSRKASLTLGAATPQSEVHGSLVSGQPRRLVVSSSRRLISRLAYSSPSLPFVASPALSHCARAASSSL